MNGRAVKRAYDAVCALDRECPTCRAGVGRPCVRIDESGRQWWRRVPCVKRVQRPLDVEVVQEVPPGVPAARDFTEPRSTTMVNER